MISFFAYSPLPEKVEERKESQAATPGSTGTGDEEKVTTGRSLKSCWSAT